MSSETSIPAVLFQTWKTKTDLPTNFAYWQKTFKDLHPTYQYRLWDDADNRAFIEKNFPWFLDRYDSFPAEIYRADAVRYFFLYRFGGIYADLDTECIRSLDPLLTGGDVILGRMGSNPAFEHSIPNAFMMSKPRQEFWLFVISLISDTIGDRPEYVTGPVVLKQAYDDYATQYREDWVQNRIANIRAKMGDTFPASNERTNVIVATPNVFFPVDWSDRIHDTFFRKPLIRDQTILDRDVALALFPTSFVVSYWAHSWESQNLVSDTSINWKNND